jgi:hypothetical protein
MRSASAFIACLLLALVAGRAGAIWVRCSQDAIDAAPSSCSFKSAALGQDITLTQACVKNDDIIGNDVTSQYFPLFQPWALQDKKTVRAFITEVYQNCAFGYPNKLDANTGPWACFKYGYKDLGYKCFGASERGAVKKHKTKKNHDAALLRAV